MKVLLTALMSSNATLSHTDVLIFNGCTQVFRFDHEFSVQRIKSHYGLEWVNPSLRIDPNRIIGEAYDNPTRGMQVVLTKPVVAECVLVAVKLEAVQLYRNQMVVTFDRIIGRVVATCPYKLFLQHDSGCHLGPLQRASVPIAGKRIPGKSPMAAPHKLGVGPTFSDSSACSSAWRHWNSGRFTRALGRDEAQKLLLA